MANNEHINKVVKSTGETLIDLTSDTVTAGTLLKDVTAHDKSGAKIVGAVIVAPTDVTETEDNEAYLYKSSEHDAIYDELVGGSVAWNQLVANSGSSLSVTITSGHKYILKKSGTLSVGASSGSAITGLTGGTDWITDLTLMFGTTIADYVYNLEQSTAGSGVEWLKSYGFFTKDYYAYNAGGLVSVNVNGKKVVGKNVLDNLTTTNTNPHYGIVFTVDRELGTVTANGTATASSGGQFSIPIPAALVGNYYFSALTSTGSDSTYDAYVWCLTDNARAKKWNGTTNSSSDYGNGNCEIRLEAGKTYTLNLRVKNSITVNNLVFKPMIRRADITDSTFEPYTSITYPIQSTDLRGLYKLNGNKLYTDGDIYSADGQITRKYGYRGYQSGDESLANAITDGTYTIYKLSAPTTETASSYTSPQMVYRNGTEEYQDTRDVPMPVGGNRKYVDIPEWMVNEYFDDVRAATSTALPLTGSTMTGDIKFDVTSSEKKLKTTSGNVEIEFDGSALHLSAADVSGQAAQHLADILLKYDIEADIAALLMGADRVIIAAANWETLISLDENGIGLTLPTNYATASNIYIDNLKSGSGSEIVIGANGDVYKSSSSRDIKHDIQYVENTEGYHDALMQIKPATYVYNNDTSETTKLGMIAEDIADVMPIATLTGENGKVENYDTRAIIAMLVMEVQRLNADIRRLRGDSDAD